jgi:hypothetical protein
VVFRFFFPGLVEFREVFRFFPGWGGFGFFRVCRVYGRLYIFFSGLAEFTEFDFFF